MGMLLIFTKLDAGNKITQSVSQVSIPVIERGQVSVAGSAARTGGRNVLGDAENVFPGARGWGVGSFLSCV